MACAQSIMQDLAELNCSETRRGFHASLGRGQPLHPSKDEEKMRRFAPVRTFGGRIQNSARSYFCVIKFLCHPERRLP